MRCAVDSIKPTPCIALPGTEDSSFPRISQENTKQIDGHAKMNLCLYIPFHGQIRFITECRDTRAQQNQLQKIMKRNSPGIATPEPNAPALAFERCCSRSCVACGMPAATIFSGGVVVM